MPSLEHLTQAALAAARDESATPAERAEMLMELAMGLQRRPQTPQHLPAAVTLYREALDVCPADAELLRARITARLGTALQTLPAEDTAPLEEALAAHQRALAVFERLGTAEEVAEAEMNRGLVLQNLAGSGRARITDAVVAYERALRTFDAARHPVEYAILQNNLATAFLSMPASDPRSRVREAIAVGCFEAGLKAVRREQHPAEFAMLQNNLGNALQYASSSHALENNLRALDAYDAALTVRRPDTAPVEYANTLANKANCLRSLGRRELARDCYSEARRIFEREGEMARLRLLDEAFADEAA